VKKKNSDDDFGAHVVDTSDNVTTNRLLSHTTDSSTFTGKIILHRLTISDILLICSQLNLWLPVVLAGHWSCHSQCPSLLKIAWFLVLSLPIKILDSTFLRVMFCFCFSIFYKLKSVIFSIFERCRSWERKGQLKKDRPRNVFLKHPSEIILS